MLNNTSLSAKSNVTFCQMTNKYLNSQRPTSLNPGREIHTTIAVHLTRLRLPFDVEQGANLGLWKAVVRIAEIVFTFTASRVAAPSWSRHSNPPCPGRTAHSRSKGAVFCHLGSTFPRWPAHHWRIRWACLGQRCRCVSCIGGGPRADSLTVGAQGSGAIDAGSLQNLVSWCAEGLASVVWRTLGCTAATGAPVAAEAVWDHRHHSRNTAEHDKKGMQGMHIAR